jgi:uncharacterized membrane protein
MHNFVFRHIANLRQNYWFWPSTMTLGAVILGFFLPYLDSRVGSDWIRSVGFIRATDVDGARAILTTLAGATLGVAGVAFSVTIVAVSFASSNYGPRLIGNFMGDRKNQIILGVFVASFVYCIIVLSTVHTQTELPETTIGSFVPQISVLFALLLMLAAVGSLIGYIHHIPESINIMNLTAEIGDKLQRAIVLMMTEEDKRECTTQEISVTTARRGLPNAENEQVISADAAGFLQQVDLQSLTAVAREEDIQIILHRAPGDFLVVGETVMVLLSERQEDLALAMRVRDCYTQGANRTDVQDILFLSDQLVEVLGRALSTGVNDPHTAMLCLNWLRAGLVEFARRPPVGQARRDDPVFYRRVTFEDMLNRSFDEIRQYVAADRTSALHSLSVLTELALVASTPSMADACVQQLRRLTRSATELLEESIARDEIEARLDLALQAIIQSNRSDHDTDHRDEAPCELEDGLPQPVPSRIDQS